MNYIIVILKRIFGCLVELEAYTDEGLPVPMSVVAESGLSDAAMKQVFKYVPSIHGNVYVKIQPGFTV